MTRRGTRRAGPATAAQRFVPGRVPEEGAIVADDMTEETERIEILERTWAAVEALGDRPARTFYATLHHAHRETRKLFPADMTNQREKLFSAIGTVIGNLRSLDQVVPTLQMLGRDHRRFGITPVHYQWVGAAMLETIGEYLGDTWRPDVEPNLVAERDAWLWAYVTVSNVMTEAADEQARTGMPAWEELVVIGKERLSRTSVRLYCEQYGQRDGMRVEQFVAEEGQHYVRPASRPALWALTDSVWLLAPPGYVDPSGEMRPAVPTFTYTLPDDARTFDHQEFMALAHFRVGEKLRVGPQPYAPTETAPEQEDDADVDA